MILPVLNKTPFPHLSLSAAGLVALADLQTIAQRTALTGTSSWFDALVLAPGLHYQQAADGVVGDNPEADAGGRGPGVFGTEALLGGGTQGIRVTNPGMLLFLARLGVREDRAREKEARRRGKLVDGVEAFADGAGAGAGGEKVVVLDVGVSGRGRSGGGGGGGGGGGRRGRAFAHEGEWELERGSHLLYLASPLLTSAAVTVMILLADWWGLAAIVALITSRMLNIYIIKQRTPAPAEPALALSSSKVSEYTIPVSKTLSVRLRGPAPDLAALATETWLRPKTPAQGYLEAVAKLAVYLVAVFGGNVSQAGNLTLLVLLLGSAGLLGLSNGFVKGVRGKGRVARVRDEQDGHNETATATATATAAEGSAGSGRTGRVGGKGPGRRGDGGQVVVRGVSSSRSWE